MTYHLLEIVTYIIELHIISIDIVLFTGKYLYLTYWRKGTTLLVKFTVHVYVAQDLRQWLSPQHHHSISNKTSKENGQILIKTAYSCYICQMFQHVSSNCINFKIWSSNFGWYTARPQTALKLIDRDGFCGQLGTPLCMSQQEGGKEINNELNRCSCHQLAERNPSILPPISVKITRISNY